MSKVMQPDLPETGLFDFLAEQFPNIDLRYRKDPVMFPEAV